MTALLRAVDNPARDDRWDDEKGGPERFSVPAEGEPFPGFRWRNDERLKINFVWVLLYITDAPSGYISRVWFDDIVAARSYIGPNPTR